METTQKLTCQELMDASEKVLKQAEKAWASGCKYDAIVLYQKALDIIKSSEFFQTTPLVMGSSLEIQDLCLTGELIINYAKKTIPTS